MREHHFIALRRVFGGSVGLTIAKGVAIGAVYWVIVLIAVSAATLVAVMTL